MEDIMKGGGANFSKKEEEKIQIFWALSNHVNKYKGIHKFNM